MIWILLKVFRVCCFFLAFSCQNSKSSAPQKDLSEDATDAYPKTENSRLVSELTEQEKNQFNKFKKQLIGKWEYDVCNKFEDEGNIIYGKITLEFTEKNILKTQSLEYKDENCTELTLESIEFEYTYTIPGVALGYDYSDNKLTYLAYMMDQIPKENSEFLEKKYSLIYVVNESTLQMANIHSQIVQKNGKENKNVRQNIFDLSAKNSRLIRIK